MVLQYSLRIISLNPSLELLVILFSLSVRRMWRNKKSRLMTKALFHLRQFRLLLLVLLCALFTLPLSAQEAYVEKSKDETTLTFYYDNNRDSRSGKTWGIDEKSVSSDPAWATLSVFRDKNIKKVKFDYSFQYFRPTSTRGWFNNQSYIESIQGIKNLNTSEVTDMSEMFYGCSSLTSLDLSNFNTSKVTDMSEMFSRCSGLTSLNLSNFNTFSVTDMRRMFSDCSGLTSLNLSNFNTSKVIDMRWMFQNCPGLKTIFNTNTWRCEKSQDMFEGCTQLKGAVKFDASKLDVTMANPEVGYFIDPYPRAYAVQSEDNKTLILYYDVNRVLRNHEYSIINEDNDYSVAKNASSRESITKVVFDASFKDFRPTTTRFWFCDLKALTTIEGLENLNTSAVTNMSWMFSGCSSLTSLNLSNLNTSEVTKMRMMFYGCSGLTSLNLSNLNTSKVTDMSEMFSGCSSLTSLDLSNFNTSEVGDMNNMFSGCSSLKTIYNPNSWKKYFGWDMFRGCTQLRGAVKYDASKVDAKMANPETGYFTGIFPKAYVQQSEEKILTFFYDTNRSSRSGKTWDIDEKSDSSLPSWSGTDSSPNENTIKVVLDASFRDFRPTTTKGWFYKLSALTTIEGLENLNTSKVTDMSIMFSGCSSLKELNLSNFNTSKVTNMNEMFKDCSDLNTIVNTQTWQCEKSQDMFKGCTQLRGAVPYDASTVDAKMANPETGYFINPYPRAYVLQSEDQQTLTFFYDANRAFRSSKTWGLYDSFGNSQAPWAGTNTSPNNRIKKVIFDISFKNFFPTITRFWFYNLVSLASIEGLENLNTSSVKDMSNMFTGCSGLKELNVSNFNTSAVTNMSWMFKNCSGLKELNVSNFNTSAVRDMSGMFWGCSGLKIIYSTNAWQCEKSKNMFSDCVQLKGAVSYNNHKVDVKMANHETGYFRYLNKKYLDAYALLSEDNNTLTFYYDVNRYSHGGRVWDIDDLPAESRSAWSGTDSSPNKSIIKVVLDASFRDFRPTTTKGLFYEFSALTTIDGLENLNTSAVTDMSNMFSGCYRLTSLNLSNFNTSAVTNMGSMFSGCSSLTSLNLSNFNTSAVTNMGSMFSGCSGLRTLNVSNFNTSAVTDMRWMFYNCSGLEELNVSNFNTSAVAYMDEMFRDCSGLKELNVSNFNTSKVTDMREMFSGCSGLTSLNVSNFNTSAVMYMRGMFEGCSGLKTILNTNTWRSDISQNMFYGCTQLKGAVKYDESKVGATMANPTTGYFTDPNKKYLEAYVQQSEDKHTLTFFYDVNRTLRSGKTWDIDEQQNASEDGTEKIPAWAGFVLIPNLETTKVVFDASFRNFLPTTTKAWFSSLQILSTIEGIENLNTSAVTDMGYMFSDCSSLKQLNVSNFNTSEVWHMNKMFSGCSGLKTIYSAKTWRCDNSKNMFNGCAQLKGAVKYDASKLDVTMANPTTGYFTEPNRKVEAYVSQSEDQHTLTFYYDNNRKLRSDKTWDIDEKNNWLRPAWAGTYSTANKAVKKVVFDASFKDFRPTTTEGWFYHLSELATIEGLENINTSAVTNMGYMFWGCSGLKELNLSNFNTAKVTNMGWMFAYCSGLTSLNVSNFNTSAVTDMSVMFLYCSGLTSLNVSNFNTSAVTNMNGMFYGCSDLKELNLSNFNTSAVTNMGQMFYDCYGLKELNVSNFNTARVTNMDVMFKNCSGLKTIINTQTWRCEKSQDMFNGCTQLKGAVKYDASKLDVTMANPTTGYFTNPNKKHLEAYVQQSEDKHTLTFFYDVNRTLRSGKTWDIDEQQNASEDGTEKIPAWAGFVLIPNLETTKVVFDASFRNFLPTTTKAWFSSLQILSTIEGIENLNTSAVTDMGYMFSDCSSLKQLNVSNFNTSKVTDMRAMFANCSGLKELNLFSFNTSAVKSMWGMFLGCSSLTSLNLSNFNTSAVRDMSLMFSGCSGLTSLNVSNFNTSAVADMSQMFFGCSDLKELNVSNFNTSAVTNMSWMFKNCSGLKELNVSNFNTSAVTDMYEMFRDCSGLKTILNPNTWLCDNSQNMFYGCTLLNGAVNYDASKVDVTMANPTTGYFTDPNREYPKAYVLQSEDQHTLTFYYDNNRKLRSGKTWGIDEKSSSSKPVWAGTYSTANKAVTKVVFDASFKNFRPTTTEGWFYHLSELATIEGLENLNTSAVTDMSAMFFRCSGLTSLNLSNFNTSAVTNMGWMFEGCSRLTSLNLSNFNTSAVTNMIAMFSRCPGLKELNISSFNTSAVKNMSWMFCDCSGLKELNISNFNTSSVTNMSQMFFGSSGLTALNLSNFNTSAVTNMSWMFKNCSGLKELNLSNFNTSAVAYMYEMFRDCSGLKTILNPNTWRFEESHDMFKGCTQLKGAVKYDGSKVDATMANPTTGYFSQKLPSAIGRVVFEDNNSTQIYTLQGKRVNANQRHLPAGFYIVNGKKVYLNEKP